MTAFLTAINEDDDTAHKWQAVSRCLDLSQVNAERSRELATKLLGVLNRLGEVTPRTLPDRAWVELTAADSYTYFPRDKVHDWVINQASPDGTITLARSDDGRWRFSAKTVAQIDNLYDSLQHLRIRHGVDERQLSLPLWIESLVPRSLKTGYVLTLKYWQWIGLFLILLVGMVLDLTVRFVLRTMSNRVIARHHASADQKTIIAAVRPLGLLFAALLWLVLLRLLGLPDGALTVLLASARVFAILVGTWSAWRITDLVGEVLGSKAAKTQTKFDDVLVPLIRKTVKIFIAVFGLIYGAGALNIPVMPMLTSLGIGGLAFAFAAKDTVENFFGSVAVILDRPFEVGDWVVMGDVEGTVEEVGFRSTRVRTFYNSQMTVPNATLVRAVVDNYGRRKYRRVKTHIGIQYDTPPDKVVAFTEGIRELVRTHPYTRKDYFQVWMHQFGASSLDILVYVFHEAPDWSTELRERERLFLDIIRLADRLGVQFAFPTQTVHLYREDPHSEHRPGELPARDTESSALSLGVQTARELTGNQPWVNQRPGPVAYQPAPGTEPPKHESRGSAGES